MPIITDLFLQLTLFTNQRLAPSCKQVPEKVGCSEDARHSSPRLYIMSGNRQSDKELYNMMKWQILSQRASTFIRVTKSQLNLEYNERLQGHDDGRCTYRRLRIKSSFLPLTCDWRPVAGSNWEKQEGIMWSDNGGFHFSVTVQTSSQLLTEQHKEVKSRVWRLNGAIGCSCVAVAGLVGNYISVWARMNAHYNCPSVNV